MSASAELELGLEADALEPLGLRCAARPSDPSCGERRHALLDQRLGMRAPQPGDERQVVVVDTLLPADLLEVADRAVVARPAVCLGPSVECGEKPLAHATVVRAELDDAEALALTAPVLDVEALDRNALDPFDLLGVEAELEDMRRLRGARQLRIDRLVPAARLQLEEIGEPAPPAVLGDEVRLIDRRPAARRGSPTPSAAVPPPGRSPRRRRSGSERPCDRRARAAGGTRPRARFPCGR